MITDEMVERAWDAWNGETITASHDVRMRAALSAALSVETRVKPLEWSQVSPPNENCSYDHTSASAAWTYQIEWKSWKDYPGYVIYRDGGYVDNEDTLGAAKAASQADYSARILSALSVEPDHAPQTHVKWPEFGSFGSATAIMDVIDERLRQQSVEGWSLEHDDAHSDGEMARAASCYAYFGSWSDSDRQKMTRRAPQNWPWELSWWKPTDRRRDLVKAAALLIAEIERLDRAALATEGNTSA